METLEELKKSAEYRYMRELCEAFDSAGIEGEPMQIPLHSVMSSRLPDYLPAGEAVQLKVMFILGLFDAYDRLPGLILSLPETKMMLHYVSEEMRGK